MFFVKPRVCLNILLLQLNLIFKCTLTEHILSPATHITVILDEQVEKQPLSRLTVRKFSSDQKMMEYIFVILSVAVAQRSWYNE